MAGTHNDGTSVVEKVGSASIAGSERFQIRSSALRETYVIDIARPMSTIAPVYPTPIIYVLDGNTLFGLTCQVVRLLEIGSDGIPPAVVIGIGYPTGSSPEDQRRRRALRLRDFTPTEDDGYWRNTFSGTELPGHESAVHTGGASTFRNFMRDELQPFVKSYLGVDSLDQTLVGMSLGGLFTLHTFFITPRMFSRWVAVSPSIWWNGRALLDIESAVGGEIADIPARLFISEGSAEEEETRVNIQELVTRLRNPRYRKLDLTHHQFDGETHQSVFPSAISRGLRTVLKVSA